MSWWQELVLAVGGGLLVFWLALVGVLAVACRGRDRAALGEGMRLLPDVIRLLRRLAADRSVPRGVRIRLGLLLGYLLMPIDLVPDFLPVIGYADDAIIVAIGLRSVVRAAGPEVIAAHWPGTDTGLTVLHRLAGLPAPETRAGRSEHEQADEPTRAAAAEIAVLRQRPDHVDDPGQSLYGYARRAARLPDDAVVDEQIAGR